LGDEVQADLPGRASGADWATLAIDFDRVFLDNDGDAGLPVKRPGAR
jgi:hypothetical protein